MTPKTQLIGLAIAIFMLLLVLELVRRRKLRIGYSLVWLVVGTGAMILIALPSLVRILAQLMGITDSRSLLFTAGIAFSLWILLDHSLTLTKLWRQDKDIAQQHALLERRVRELQEELDRLRTAKQPHASREWEETPALPGALEYSLSYQTEDAVHEQK